MVDTVLTELKIHEFDTVSQFLQHESEVGENDLAFTPEMPAFPILTRVCFDHIVNNVSWLRADTFSWQSGDFYVATYEHLKTDAKTAYAWISGSELFYTSKETVAVGDEVYVSTTKDSSTIDSVGSNTITFAHPRKDGVYTATRSTANDRLALGLMPFMQRETIDGTTIEFIVADDGHRICLPDQEANIIHVYNRTGYANYYILDTENKQFKLPRKQKRKLILSFKEDNAQNVWYKLYSDGWVEQGGFLADSFGGSYEFAFPITMADTNYTLTTGAGCPNIGGMHGKDYIASRSTGGFVYANGSLSNNFVNNNFSWQVSGYANPALVPSSLLELEYYYVGHFEQDSVEQTAGINAEMFNGKADRNLMNTTDNVDIVIESQLPTASNGYTWYKKYKSGWVEQGGSPTGNSSTVYTGTLPVEMADTNYTLVIAFNVKSSGTGGYSAGWDTKTTTGFTTRGFGAGSATVNTPNWYACGMSA